MSKEISSKYNPKEHEEKIYQLWEKSGAFSPQGKGKPFVIVIPPPNVTGSLHMGHALNNTIQDILIRRARMKGIPSLWIPGTDHAGIATQNVVEKELAKEGKTRQELGKEKFIEKVWQWKEKYGHIIIDQLKTLGASADWSRERFTMDEGYSEAVKTAFLHYQKKGWIYQGERVINWCVRCQTALSDIEIEYREKEGKLWFIRYQGAGIREPIIVATTRPETMLGDTAVAVNPEDKRYKEFVGKKLILPLLKREIPVVADEAVDPKFGTGAVKVTPAHDPTDFEIGERHGLPNIKVIDEKGVITAEGKEYRGLDRFKARKAILEDLEKEGLLEKTEDYTNKVPHCYRCGTVLEPLLSKQWFVKMKELAKPAIEAVKKGEIKFVPERWEKVYLDWLKNIKDWCISRQIWWGHKIPIEGVEDVLDTWFSSALWPFAVFGWPEKNSKLKTQNSKLSDLAYFYPTTILSTARDIIFLWVARMVFSGYEFMGKKPFETVYIHPTIFNIEGKRMSKSLGTGIDPLDLIEKYGADATRFGLTFINTGVQDIKFEENAILAGQKFANKIWNISRFVMLQIGDSGFKIHDSRKIPEPKSEADKKILEKTDEIIKSTDDNLDKFRFGQAAHELYDFVWHDFADIYLEASKKQMEEKKYQDSTADILLYVLTTSLKLLHPIMPFVTEAVWESLGEKKLLILSRWPE